MMTSISMSSPNARVIEDEDEINATIENIKKNANTLQDAFNKIMDR